MGYYSDVAFAISKDVDNPTYEVDGEQVVNGDDDGEPYWFLEELLSIADPDEYHKLDGDYYFFWKGTKWYENTDKRNYVEQLTSNLSNNDITYGYVIVGEDIGDIYTEGDYGYFDIYPVTKIEIPDEWDPEPQRPFDETDPFGEEKHTLTDWCIMSGIDVNDPVVIKAINEG